MKKFMELWIFEWNRAKRFYGFLLAFVTALQAYAVFHEYHFWKNGYENYRQQNYAALPEQYLQDYGYLTLEDVTNNSFFVFSIMTAIFALLFYAVFIWYQDWSGKNRFSFRLLSLPGNRFAVYAAKFATIWLLITGLQVWQIGLLYLEGWSFPDLFRRTSIGKSPCRWHQPALLHWPWLYQVSFPIICFFTLLAIQRSL